MKKLMALFGKKSKQEIAPQLTVWDRQALARPGSPSRLGYDTYARMQVDPMVQTALTIKKLGVLAGQWSVLPASDSAEANQRARFAEDALDRMDGSPLTVMEGAMDAFANGWSVQECVYEQESGRWWLRAAKPKDPSMFGLRVDAFGNVEDLLLELPGEPAHALPRSKFVLYSHRSRYGGPRGQSDLDAAYPHWVSKRALLEAWQLHLERFGSPTMLGRYAVGTPEADRLSALTGLSELATHRALLMPSDIEVEPIGGDPAASRGFMEAIDHHNREIARCILGQTLTTDEGRRVGSLTLGKVHLQVLVLQLQAIRKDLAERVMTEQVLRPLVELNFGPGEMPVFRFAETPIDAFRTGEIV
jgi:phage gp29-like protein